jgi:hypothetical protein
MQTHEDPVLFQVAWHVLPALDFEIFIFFNNSLNMFEHYKLYTRYQLNISRLDPGCPGNGQV